MGGLIFNLAFHTEDPYGVRDRVNIFLFPDLSLSASSEAVLVLRWWDMALDSSILTMYADTDSLLQIQKVALIVRWEASNIMFEQWYVCLPRGPVGSTRKTPCSL